MEATSGIMSVLAVVVALGGFGLPLGIPPLPEDRLMSAVAPEECLIYTTWSGTAAPDPASGNQTEQLLAEPEIRSLLTNLEGRIVAAVQGAARREGPEAAAMADDAAIWVKRLLTSPAALFVSKATVSETGADVRGGILVKVGDDVGRLKATLEKYQAAVFREAIQPTTVTGVACYRLNLPPPAPPVTWGVKGGYVLIGVGEGEIEGMLNRAIAPPPPWLIAIRQRLATERQSTLTFVDTGKLLEGFASALPPETAAAIRAIGFHNVTAIASATGLDQEGIVSRTLVVLSGEPQGLVAALIAGRLTAHDVAPIPSDATIALAAKLDAQRVYDAVVSAIGKIEPRARDEIPPAVKEIERELQINLQQDLLAPLGDTWCVYNSPGEGGLLFTGLTAVVGVDDHAKLSAAHARLLQAAKGILQEEGGPRAPSIEHFRFAGQDVYTFNARDDEFPLAPSWCLTENALIVAPFPQNVKAYLIRGADFTSLASSPAVAGFLQPSEGPMLVSYIDTRRVFELVYPLAPMVAQMASVELAREGIDFNVSILPSAGAIGKHLRPDVTVVRRTQEGIEVTNRRTNPILSVGSVLPMAAAGLVPAIGSARGASARSQSMNNLKMVGLAMHNYHAANHALPPAYTVDNAGKPLLSWRVLILPYIYTNEQALYESFHLDEPWDSVHNRQLLEKMPPWYRSPGSRLPPGMTRYLTVRGPNTVFPGKEKTSFADIPDGTSGTIMAVEAGEEAAVPWTKPDDFAFDPDDPAAGLFGPRDGCIALFCDGSVRFLSKAIDGKSLKGLFERNDGKVVNTPNPFGQ
jgi:hypothetical protein